MKLRLQNFLLPLRRRCSRISAMQSIVLTFLVIILVGSLLLSLPAKA